MQIEKVTSGSTEKVRFELYSTDGKNIKTDAVFAAGDVKISKDGGAAVNVTNLPAYAANGFELEWTPAAGELTFTSSAVLRVKDQGTETWLERGIKFELDLLKDSTFGLAVLKAENDTTQADIASHEAARALMETALITEHDTTQSAIASHESARSTMETTLVGEHGATQALLEDATFGLEAIVDAIAAINITVIGGPGSTSSGYTENAGTYFVEKGDGVDIPFRFLGDATGFDLWYSVRKVKESGVFVIGPKKLTGWASALEADGNIWTTGVLPHTYAETINQKACQYFGEIKRYDDVNDPVTVWSAEMQLVKYVAEKADLVP